MLTGNKASPLRARAALPAPGPSYQARCCEWHGQAECLQAENEGQACLNVKLRWSFVSINYK